MATAKAYRLLLINNLVALPVNVLEVIVKINSPMEKTVIFTSERCALKPR